MTDFSKPIVSRGTMEVTFEPNALVKVLFRGGPHDGRVSTVMRGCKSVVCPDYANSPFGGPYSQLRYEPSGHMLGDAEIWVLSPWKP